MLVGYSYDPIYARHDMGEGHPECPERVQLIDAHLRSVGLLEQLTSFSAKPAEREDVLLAHEESYVDRVFALAPQARESVQLDADTAMNEASLPAVLMAVGAAIAAVNHVIDGRLNRAFCNIRPPGHHAESNRAMGFCIFNSIAVAARYACMVRNLERIAIVDWDVHHGNGTEEMGTTVNIPVAADPPAKDFLAMLADETERLAKTLKPDIVFLSAGFDAHRADPVGGLTLESEDYEEAGRWIAQLAKDYCGGRLISLLEGGYHLQRMPESVDAHLNGITQGSKSSSPE